MKEYPDNIPWIEVWFAFFQLAVLAAVFAVVYYATRMTPEREAELKADGAAAFDAKVERAGGWEKWLAGEIMKVKVEGEGEQRMEVR